MTCIAWDGKTIAADKRATCAGVHNTTTKLRRIATGEILAWTGDEDAGRIVARWYENGALLEKWPQVQTTDQWSRLIVASKSSVKIFERQPESVEIEDKFHAWGSGRDFALAAMYLGKSAAEAVEIACVFDTSCGNGIDVIEL
jgi:hypothetical protein